MSIRADGTSYDALRRCLYQRSNTVGIVRPPDRVAPLTPATRDQLEANGASCTPNPTGPVLCTWSGGQASCTITFDANDDLTHLQCTIDSLGWECTRPGNLFVCRWSDDPDCADVYRLDGTFEAYLCGDALADRINQNTPTDGGQPAPDSGITGPCSGLSEEACTAAGNAICEPYYCYDCNGNGSFVHCGPPNMPPPCAPPVCGCEQHTDEASCEADPACRSVYVDPMTCNCPELGCCTQFRFCADGPSAECIPPLAVCESEPPHCEGEYVVGYLGGCHEGCVKASDCEPQIPFCTATQMYFPPFHNTCTTDQDCFAAIHQINCCGTDHALGLNVGEMMSFDGAEAFCRAQYPACECLDQGIECDDGNFVAEESRVGVRCDNLVCTTYAMP